MGGPPKVERGNYQQESYGAAAREDPYARGQGPQGPQGQCLAGRGQLGQTSSFVF